MLGRCYPFVNREISARRHSGVTRLVRLEPAGRVTGSAHMRSGPCPLVLAVAALTALTAMSGLPAAALAQEPAAAGEETAEAPANLPVAAAPSESEAGGEAIDLTGDPAAGAPPLQRQPPVSGIGGTATVPNRFDSPRATYRAPVRPGAASIPATGATDPSIVDPAAIVASERRAAEASRSAHNGLRVLLSMAVLGGLAALGLRLLMRRRDQSNSLRRNEPWWP